MVLVCFLVWWANVYSPLQDQRDELVENIAQASQERDRLVKRLKRLSNTKENRQEIQGKLTRLSSLVVKGKTVEEINAVSQLWIQGFLEGRDISVTAYKGLPPSTWGEYPLGLVQFQLRSSTQGLSDLLEKLEKAEKVVRIERLRVNYRRGKENNLRISLHLGTLFVGGGGNQKFT